MNGPDDAAILEAEANILAMAEELTRLKRLSMLHADWCAHVERFHGSLEAVSGSLPAMSTALETRANALDVVINRLAQVGVDARTNWSQVQIVLQESVRELQLNIAANQQLLDAFKQESQAQWLELHQKAEVIHDRIGKQVGVFIATALETRANALDVVINRLAQAGVDARTNWSQVQIVLQESARELQLNIAANQQLLDAFKQELQAQWLELHQKAEVIHDRIGKQVGVFIAKRFQEELVKLDEHSQELRQTIASSTHELSAFKQDMVAWMRAMREKSEAEFARQQRQVEAILNESAQLQVAAARMQKMMPAFGLAKLLWAIAALVLAGLLVLGGWYAVFRGGL
jgi:short-subunit dehydrogenase involved in D-alanine esterification of teichoic acids